MTIPNGQVRVGYIGDSVSTAFAVPFPFFAAFELLVCLVNPAFGATPLVLNSAYSVAGGNDAPGTVTLQQPLAIGTNLLIVRQTNRTQLAQLLANDNLSAATLETAYDRAAAIDAEDLDLLGQTVRAPIQDNPMNPLPTAAQRAGGALYFDPLGNPIVLPGGATTINFSNLKNPLLPPSDFAGSYGYSTQVQPGGTYLQQSQVVGSEAPFQLNSWLETYYHADGAVPVDYPGAYLATVPLGLFVQHVAYGSNTANNAGTASIIGYGVNDAAGDNDCVGVIGRAKKMDVPGGIGDACGVFGSTYNLSQQIGGTPGLEGAIYQNVPGIGPLDGLGNHWSCAIHGTAAGTGCPASAALALDGTSAVPGMFGAWNGIIIDANLFAEIGTPGNAGTVGINCGTWTSLFGPRYGIKFGPCQCHIFSTDQLNLQANKGVYFDQRTNGTGAPVVFDMDVQATSLVLFRSGGDDPGGANDILQIFGNIKAVNCTNLLTTKIFAITASLPPASSNAAGVVGQIEWDANYIYVCTATNTWRRTATATF